MGTMVFRLQDIQPVAKSPGSCDILFNKDVLVLVEK